MATKYTKDHMFTEEQKKFLINNIHKYTYRELTEHFNREFKTSLKIHSIQDVCLKRLGIKRNKPYHFKKGPKEFNSLPIGSERKVGRETFIKIDDKYIEGVAPNKASNSNWKRKQDVVWEKKHGKKPKEGLIVFLDKDRNNFNIDNLYCTTRAINFMMAKNKWYNKNPEITLTALKWCELFYALKNN